MEDSQSVPPGVSSVSVTVWLINGVTLFGPDFFAAPVLVKDLKKKALGLCEGPFDIRLLQGPVELPDDGQFDVGPVELSAVLVKFEPLSARELHRCKDLLGGQFSRAAPIFASLSERERANHEIVLAAAAESIDALMHAHPWVMTDTTFLLKLLSKNGSALQYVHHLVRENKALVLAAVKSSDDALQFATTFTSDREVVIAAVQRCGRALRFASDSLRAEDDVVMCAVSENGYALEDAHSSLKGKKHIVIRAVAKNGCALKFVDQVLTDDRDVVGAAVKQNGIALQYASLRLREDPDIVAVASLQNYDALRYSGIGHKLKASFHGDD